MNKYLLYIKSFSFQFKSINLKQNDDNLIKIVLLVLFDYWTQ